MLRGNIVADIRARFAGARVNPVTNISDDDLLLQSLGSRSRLNRDTSRAIIAASGPGWLKFHDYLVKRC